jgi:Bacterial PH domain
VNPEAAYSGEADAPVRSKPIVSTIWCYGVAAVVLAAFVTIAAILKSSSDGVTFHASDQWAMVGLGLGVAGLAILPTRPRMAADARGVYLRGILGPYRFVPWDLVQSVEFRPRWRWARLVLAADETMSLYAVQRWDGTRSVEVMRALRQLHAQASTNV